jgi:hypothetical protein
MNSCTKKAIKIALTVDQAVKESLDRSFEQYVKNSLERIVRRAAMQEARTTVMQKALDEALAAKSALERQLRDAETLVAQLRGELAALQT